MKNDLFQVVIIIYDPAISASAKEVRFHLPGPEFAVVRFLKLIDVMLNRMVKVSPSCGYVIGAHSANGSGTSGGGSVIYSVTNWP